MTGDEIPVQRVERASAVTSGILHVIKTLAAVIAHAVDVGARRGIGLAANHAAIRVQRHAAGVGHFHPFIGVGVDRQIPFIHRVRVQAGQQREIARDHQPLDVMRIGVAHGLPDHHCHAAHAGGAGPKKFRQSFLRPQRITRRIFRHVEPINAAHEFPPAQNLPDKSFHGVQGRRTCPVCLLRRAAQSRRVQQPQIQRRGHQRVEHERLVRRHRVLPVPEILEPHRQKFREPGFRLRRRHGVIELIGAAIMRRKLFFNQRHHLSRYRIGRKPFDRWWTQTLWQRLAIFGVKIPFAPSRHAPVHQHAMRPAHFPVEKFHPQLRLAARENLEEFSGSQKPVILQHLHLYAARRLPTRHILRHAPFPRRRHHDFIRPQRRRGAPHLARQTLRIRRIIQPRIANGKTISRQRRGKMPHRREHQNDFLWMVRHIGAFPHHLRQQHRITGRSPPQRRHATRKLVPQYNPKRAHTIF